MFGRLLNYALGGMGLDTYLQSWEKKASIAEKLGVRAESPKSLSQRLAERMPKKTAALVKQGIVTVHNTDEIPLHQFRLMPTEWTDRIHRDGYYVSDMRDQTKLASIVMDGADRGLSNPVGPGLYKVFMADGKFRDCFVLYQDDPTESGNRESRWIVLDKETKKKRTAIVALLLHRVGKMQDKLFRMANYDALTNIPNRHFLMTYLPDIAEKSLKKRTSFALLLIDLDNFKTVNDQAGHDAGDEFVQIVPGVGTEEEACAAAKKVFENFRTQTLDRFIEKYRVGLSVGVALFPYHTENFNVLIKYADIAMYHAKRGGKNAFRIYGDEMSREDPDADSEQQDAPRHDRRSVRRRRE